MLFKALYSENFQRELRKLNLDDEWLERLARSELSQVAVACQVLETARLSSDYASPRIYCRLGDLAHILPAVQLVRQNEDLYRNVLALRQHYYPALEKGFQAPLALLAQVESELVGLHAKSSQVLKGEPPQP